MSNNYLLFPVFNDNQMHDDGSLLYTKPFRRLSWTELQCLLKVPGKGQKEGQENHGPQEPYTARKGLIRARKGLE